MIGAEIATARLNYCSKAIEWMQERVSSALYATLSHDLLHRLQQYAIAPLLDSVKFIAPLGGKFFPSEDMARTAIASLPTVRLPYDVIAIEYPADDPVADKQIALAMTFTAAQRYRLLGPHNFRDDDAPSAEDIFVFSVSSGPDPRTNGAWVLAPFFAILALAPQSVAPMQMKVHTFSSDSSDFGDPKDRVTDIQREAWCVGELCAALFHGVRYAELPAPKRLNEKRAQKDKPPLFEYKLLELHPRIVALYDALEDEEDGGSAIGEARRSPRLHTRRGHWRHRQEGKVSWVRPSIVGKKDLGVILKDYVAAGVIAPLSE